MRWPEERRRGTKRKGLEATDAVAITSPSEKTTEPCDRIDSSIASPATGLSEQPRAPVVDNPDLTSLLPSNRFIPFDTEDEVEDIVRNDMLPRSTSETDIQPWIASVDAGTRMLFSYFSEVIAPVMVVLDTVSNGYREVILPMALENDILRRSVSVVAAQHLSRHAPDVRDAAEASRSIVISHLRQQSQSASEDQVFNQFTWATLIVLLVGETVTGSPTCSFILRMLLCLADNSRTRNEDSDVARFLQTQTMM